MACAWALPASHCQRFLQAQQILAETSARVQRAGAGVAGEHREGEAVAVVAPGPRFGKGKQGATDPAPIAAAGYRKVGNVAVAGAREEVALQLQMQECHAFASGGGGDEERRVRATRPPGAGEIGPDCGHALAPAAAAWQLEGDEPRHQRENELEVAGSRRSDRDTLIALGRRCRAHHPNNASGIAITLAALAWIAAWWVRVRGRMQA